MILFQRSRILIDVIDESKQEEFIKRNTIYEKNMSFGYNEKWTSIAEVEYNGEVYIALPRSYPINFAKSYALDTTCKLDNSYDDYETCDIELKPGITFKNDIQKLLSDFLYGRNSYKNILNKPRRALFADTGIGKTFLTINNICETKLKPIIFCPDDRAIKTWKEELLKFTNLSEDEILCLKCVSNIKKAIKNKSSYKVVLFSINTASSMFTNNNVEDFIKFMNEFKFGLKVFDEMHLRLKSIFFVDMYTNTYKTIYLTATNNMRIYGEQKVMEYMTPSEECVYLQEPVKKFELIKFIYHSTPSNYTEVSKRIQKINGFDANEYLKYVFRDEPVTEFFLHSVIRPVYKHALKLIKEDKQKVAILFKSIESGKIVGKYLQTLYPDLKIGYFNSEIKDMKIREKELDCELIISTDKSFSGILNIYNLSVIIISTPITSIAHIKQIMGRLRDEPNKRRIVMQLCDNTFKKAKDMLYRQTKVCEPVTTSIKEHFINQPTIITKVELVD